MPFPPFTRTRLFEGPSHRPYPISLPGSIHRGSGLQIDLLPLAADDGFADLGRRFALFRLFVGIVKLFQADVALGAMRALEATVQAVVAHAPIAVAITRLLMDDVRNLRG